MRSLGGECTLDGQTREKMFYEKDNAWIIDDESLLEVDSDIQLVVDCTRNGQSILFNVTSPIVPKKRIIVQTQITIGTYQPGKSGTDDKPSRTSVQCPNENQGILAIE